MPTNNICTTFKNNHSPAFSHFHTTSKRFDVYMFFLSAYMYVCVCDFIIYCISSSRLKPESLGQYMFLCVLNLLCGLRLKIARNGLITVQLSKWGFGDGVKQTHNRENKAGR